jgi:TolB-like protein/Flp pilus assembly protein TadD
VQISSGNAVGSFFEELKRRNVVRVAIAYVVTAWLLIEISATLEQTLRLPDWADSLLAFFLILGFPVALFFSWAFEMTPEGLKRESEVGHDVPSRAITARRLNIIIVVMLAAAVGYFAIDRLDEDIEQGPMPSGNTVADLSIAVLPFVNMSSDPEQEYFSDGLTEELLNLLAGITELDVAARTSSFFYKDKLDTVPLIEIAAQLSVAHILEGSVRKSGNKIRVTAQLIEAESGFHLWSETCDRELNDIFEIQDEIAASVADELRITLLGDAGQSRVIDTKSYELALQGRFFYNRRGEGDLERAFDRFSRAVEIDPRNATAWAGLAPLYFMIDDRRDKVSALTAAENAVELEPNNPEAVVRHAQMLYWSDRDDEADLEWQRAIELGQDNALVLSMVAGPHCRRGEFERCLHYQRLAVDVDPLHPVNLGNLAGYYVWAGEYENAEAPALRLLEIVPDSTNVRVTLAEALLAQGRLDEAMAQLDKVRVDDPSHEDMIKKAQLVAAVQFSLGDTDAADKALRQFIEQYGDSALFELAGIHAWRGETEIASELLRRMLVEESYVDDFLLMGPLHISMRDDPNWQELARQSLY